MKQRHYDICGVNYDEECDCNCTHVPSTKDVYTDFANAVGNDVLIENWHREELRKAKVEALRDAAQAIHEPVPTLDDSIPEFYSDWLKDRADKEERVEL